VVGSVSHESNREKYKANGGNGEEGAETTRSGHINKAFTFVDPLDKNEED